MAAGRIVKVSGPLIVADGMRDARWTKEGPASSGIAFEEIRRAFVKAVGQDISTK